MFFSKIVSKVSVFLDSMGTSHKLDNHVQLSSPENVHSELRPGQVHTAP